ncbi:MAG: EF-P lysine aminoacylase GenX [Parcubacteria group bacterium]|nr:EF-P lysine aminoacylase GenX [Parcubacteria group bacterium]
MKIIETQIKRAQIIDFIREFFKQRGFLEVQTPILVKGMSTEPYIDPIKVEFFDERNKKYQGYLITSPEYSLKKLLAQGFENIFEITKAFRQNEAFGKLHNPEFTILEWYHINADYRDVMVDTEQLIYYVTTKIHNQPRFLYQGREVDVSLPWLRMSVKDAFQKWAYIDLDKKQKMTDFNDWFYDIFLNKIEPHLPQNKPIILYDYPLPQAALAKRKSKNSFYAERFEVYIAGIELCNAFSELTDWQEQLKRLKEDQEIRKKLKKEIIPIDKTFINALKSGLPPVGGNALGIDRLEMLLLDIKDIDDLLTFPTNKMFK